jgi:hypothetical protein
MAATVRVFAHSGLIASPVRNANLAQSVEGLLTLTQPYLAGESLSASTGAAVASASATAPSGTTLLRMEIQAGKTIAYEVTPQGQDLRSATSASPYAEGRVTLSFGPGWRVSVLEIASP